MIDRYGRLFLVVVAKKLTYPRRTMGVRLYGSITMSPIKSDDSL